ncbi:MAG: hydrogenase maturation nickel metallochaperone HypA [Halobacteriales archaeon]
MHELSVAQELVERAVEAAADHDAARIDELTLAVGRATHLNPDQLVFCVRTVAEGTPAADATVEVEMVTPCARCDCGWTGEPETLDDAAVFVPDPLCPSCGDRVELIRGRGCRLERIDVPAAATAEPTDTTPGDAE